MSEEEFLERVLNKIAKEFGYDVASTLELMFIKKEKELDQYKNNWEELKKMFEADEHFEDGCYCSEILNKMKELEEKNGEN